MPTYSQTKCHDSVDGWDGAVRAQHDETLRQMNSYILDAVRRRIPRAIVSDAVLDLEIDEIAQRTRIKLWQAIQREHIVNIRSYINRIVYTEIIDFVRRFKPIVPLPLDEDGELYQEHILTTLNASSPDPAEQFEQTEMVYSLMRRLAQAVQSLPPKQRQAMLCALKDYSIGNKAFVEMFTLWGLDVTNAHWPLELRELQSLRASLSVVRRKLSSLKDAA